MTKEEKEKLKNVDKKKFNDLMKKLLEVPPPDKTKKPTKKKKKPF